MERPARPPRLLRGGGGGRGAARGPALRKAFACALLALAVGLVFGRVAGHDFVVYDDSAYISENPFVARGLTMEGIGWAFTQRHAANWHPLTWISHMLDSQFFGLDAGAHHLTSVVLHAITAMVLFLVLQRLTGRLWASAFVAAVFAVHPLRAESVAWVAERKDVLSGLFFALTLWAYRQYVVKPASLARYLWLLAVYALGLMSKPMLVTVPPLLLVLDHWPLGRMRRLGFARLAREKVPLAALAAASSLVTLWAQREALMPADRLPFAWRLGNALVAYVDYAATFVFPRNLSVFYPHPGTTLAAWKVVAAALALLCVSAGVLAWRRERPYLLSGWLWYLGMLVPVIGLAQVGEQALADRYTYLPQIGLGLALAWAGAASCRSGNDGRRVAGAASLAVVLLGVIAWRQTGYWRNDETLFTHALAGTSKNHVAHNSLGVALVRRGEVDEAITHYREALAIKPGFAEAHNNLGAALVTRGQLDEALDRFRTALKLKPRYAEAHNNLGAALVTRGRAGEAIDQFRAALELNPGFAEAEFNLGAALAASGQGEGAVTHYRRALDLDPDHVKAHNNLGTALLVRGQVDEAAAHFRRAIEVDPRYAESRNNLGFALAAGGKVDEAITQYRKALEIKPDYVKAHNGIGIALARLGRNDEAIAHFRKAVEFNPDFADAHGNLGTALAERRQFDEAIVHLRKGLGLAEQQGKQALGEQLRRKLAACEAERPAGG